MVCRSRRNMPTRAYLSATLSINYIIVRSDVEIIAQLQASKPFNKIIDDAIAYQRLSSKSRAGKSDLRGNSASRDASGHGASHRHGSPLSGEHYHCYIVGCRTNWNPIYLVTQKKGAISPKY